jgi:hypothetical protein
MESYMRERVTEFFNVLQIVVFRSALLILFIVEAYRLIAGGK